MDVKIFLYDIDVTKLFFEEQTFENTKAYSDGNFYIPELTFSLYNRDNFFDIDGILFGKRAWFLNAPIKIIIDNIVFWEGLLSNIDSSDTSIDVSFTTINKSFKLFEKSINYTRTGITPVDVLIDFCEFGKINFDEGSFNEVKGLMTSKNVRINAFFSSENNFVLSSAIGEIINRSAIYGYFFNNKLFIQNLGKKLPTILLEEKDVKNESSRYDYELYNEYDIDWQFGKEKDSNQLNQGIGLQSRLKYGEFVYSDNGGTDSSITFLNKETAIYIGTSQIQNRLEPKIVKNLTLPISYSLILNINKYISYKNKTWEVMKVSFIPESHFIESEIRLI